MIASPTNRSEPYALPERELLDSWLDFHRATLLSKCADLTDEQLKARAVPSSAMTLLGLLRHMTVVETWWFDTMFLGLTADDDYPYVTADDTDGDFNNLDDSPVAAVEALFLANCERSRKLVANLSLDQVAVRSTPAKPFDLRWIYVHMIEEYARHNGHADLLRELIDGQTGVYSLPIIMVRRFFGDR